MFGLATGVRAASAVAGVVALAVLLPCADEWPATDRFDGRHYGRRRRARRTLVRLRQAPKGLARGEGRRRGPLRSDAALVVDAGGNSLLRVDNEGAVEVLATFPVELLSTANFNELAGCPPEVPLCAIGAPAIPGESVPTSVVVGPDGDYWVGELKGFPAPTGQSGVWRIDGDATGVVHCGVDPECTKPLDGFTSIVDLALGPDGRLYVSELDEASWAAVEIFGTVTGGTLNACDLASEECEVVATGVPEHTAVTFGKDGTPWVTIDALVPGGAQVLPIP